PPSLHVATSGIEKVAGTPPSSQLSFTSKTSWKNEVGGWGSRRERHRCVAFGKLGLRRHDLLSGTRHRRGELAATNNSAKSLSPPREHPSCCESRESVSTACSARPRCQERIG